MNLRLIMERLAQALALVGGITLIAMTVITCVSIIGRAAIPLGLGPVPGDFELVEAGAGLAVFAFLPWCQISRGHASVDIFTAFLPERVNRFIDLIAEILMTVVLIVIAWRLFVGTGDKMRYQETTFILQFPLWWAYATSLVGAIIACVISVYMVWVRAVEFATGRLQFGPSSGAAH